MTGLVGAPYLVMTGPLPFRFRCFPSFSACFFAKDAARPLPVSVSRWTLNKRGQSTTRALMNLRWHVASGFWTSNYKMARTPAIVADNVARPTRLTRCLL